MKIESHINNKLIVKYSIATIGKYKLYLNIPKKVNKPINLVDNDIPYYYQYQVYQFNTNWNILNKHMLEFHFEGNKDKLNGLLEKLSKKGIEAACNSTNYEDSRWKIFILESNCKII